MPDSTVVPEADLRDFFRKEVSRALETLKVESSDMTTFYLVNLLAEFGETDELYEEADRPLALIYAKAM